MLTCVEYYLLSSYMISFKMTIISSFWWTGKGSSAPPQGLNLKTTAFYPPHNEITKGTNILLCVVICSLM